MTKLVNNYGSFNIFDIKNLNKFIQIKQFEYPVDGNNNNIDSLDALSKDILYRLDNWWKKENEIKTAIEKYLEKGLSLQLKRVDVLQRKKSGKLKQFESLV